jgi:hypothetical protein
VSEAAGTLGASGLRVEVQGRDGVRFDLLQERGRVLLGRDPGIDGAFIGKATDALDGVDPPAGAFEAIVAEREAKRIRESRERAEQGRDNRRRQRDKALYGVELDGE